jgi:hypothetical protein
MPDPKKLTFNITDQGNVPTGRNGKHKSIVARILGDLDGLPEGQALKISLAELPDTKVNIRSALSRASRKQAKSVATAADDDYLYVWNS